MEHYAKEIKDRYPLLFTSHFSLLTEFGRWVYVNAGWTVSRVEYMKHDPGINTAMIHAGADLFLRECLNPKSWPHEYSVFNKSGNLKSGNDVTPYNLAGPLCFSGDILARNVELPIVEEGDYLVIHDTGGYTFSMWSRYNSRQTPRIIGYQGGEFKILREREGFDEVMDFWR
jgi:diaminopimelate decarboxylase